MTTLAIVNATVFLALSSLHFYWAVGGKWSLDASVPSRINGEKVFSISPLSCVVVGGGLTFFAFLQVLNAKLIFTNKQFSFLKYANLCVAIIFLARTIGDFKWAGLFRKVNGTSFARNDSSYYVPLSIFLSVSSLILALLQ